MNNDLPDGGHVPPTEPTPTAEGSNPTGDHRLPTWAPRVPKHKIRRLYELDAQGIIDDDLIDDVGYGLWARGKAFITACAAVRGEVVCPACGAILHRAGHDKTQVMVCGCRWSLSWGDYFETIQRKQLSGAEPVLALFGSYVDRFPEATTPRARMLLIDELLHGFHWYYKTGTPTRPVAINLIEGRLSDVIDFLDTLTYGSGSTPGLRDRKAEWDERIVYARSWGRDAP